VTFFLELDRVVERFLMWYDVVDYSDREYVWLSVNGKREMVMTVRPTSTD
jgi:hypothetical protein